MFKKNNLNKNNLKYSLIDYFTTILFCLGIFSFLQSEVTVPSHNQSPASQSDADDTSLEVDMQPNWTGEDDGQPAWVMEEDAADTSLNKDLEAEWEDAAVNDDDDNAGEKLTVIVPVQVVLLLLILSLPQIIL